MKKIYKNNPNKVTYVGKMKDINRQKNFFKNNRFYLRAFEDLFINHLSQTTKNVGGITRVQRTDLTNRSFCLYQD